MAAELAIARPVRAAPPTESAANTSPSAEDLYYEGSARFSAADYTGAIELFTKALAVATRERLPFSVRAAFLINLARAHAKAYGVDGDAKHLRLAKEIYERYLREAQSTGEQNEVPEIRTEVADLERKLSDLEKKPAAIPPPEPTRTPSPRPTASPTQPNDRRKPIGIGLLAGGGSAAILGIGGLVWGSMFKPRAEDQISPGDEGTAEADAFLTDEKRKGTILMSVGGVLIGIGLAAIVTGAVLLSRSRGKPKAVAVFTGDGVRISF